MYPQSNRSLAIVDIDASFVNLWVHLSFAIFAIFDLKGPIKLLEMAFDQVQTCLIFSFRWAHFPMKNSRKAQWVYPFSMNFNCFRSVCLYLSLKVHFRWEHHILSMKGCHAIRPEYNCFCFDDNFRRYSLWVRPLTLIKLDFILTVLLTSPI